MRCRAFLPSQDRSSRHVLAPSCRVEQSEVKTHAPVGPQRGQRGRVTFPRHSNRTPVMSFAITGVIPYLRAGPTRAAASGCRLRARYHINYLPIPQRRRAHRPRAIELLNFNVLRSRSLVCHGRRRVNQLLTWLTLLARWLAGLLRRERFLVPVELGLFPDVDLILLRRGK